MKASDLRLAAGILTAALLGAINPASASDCGSCGTGCTVTISGTNEAGQGKFAVQSGGAPRWDNPVEFEAFPEKIYKIDINWVFNQQFQAFEYALVATGTYVGVYYQGACCGYEYQSRPVAGNGTPGDWVPGERFSYLFDPGPPPTGGGGFTTQHPAYFEFRLVSKSGGSPAGGPVEIGSEVEAADEAGPNAPVEPRVRASIPLGSEVHANVRASSGYFDLPGAISSALAEPRALVYRGPGEGVNGCVWREVENGIQVIRRVVTGNFAAEVVPPAGSTLFDATSFDVKIYSSGQFPAAFPEGQTASYTGAPLAIYSFEGVAAVGGSHGSGLKITAALPGLPLRETTLVPLTTGGSYRITDGAKVTTVEASDYDQDGDRFETETVSEFGRVTSCIGRAYRIMSGSADERIVSETIYTKPATEQGPQGPLTTTWAYYEDSPYFHPVKSVVRPDGSWIYHTYGNYGLVAKTYEPFLDSPAAPQAVDGVGKVTAYVYGEPYPAPPYAVTPEERAPWEVAPDTALTIKTVDINGTPAAKETIDRERMIEENPAGGYFVLGEVKHTRREFASEAAGDYVENIYWTRFSPNEPAEFFNQIYQTQDPGGRTSTRTHEQVGDSLKIIWTEGTAASPGGVAALTTRTTSTRNTLGLTVQETEEVCTGDSETPFDVVSVRTFSHDQHSRLTARSENGVPVEQTAYESEEVTATTDESGATTRTTRDRWGRPVAIVTVRPDRPDKRTSIEYDGLTTRTFLNGRLIATETRDGTGTVVSSTDEAGLLTTTAPDVPNRLTTVTGPDTGTRVTESYPDGRVKNVTGTGGVAEYHRYAISEDDELVETIWLGIPPAETEPQPGERCTIRTYDWLGRVKSVRTPNPNVDAQVHWVTLTNTYQPGTGHLQTTTSSAPNTAATFHTYDALGRPASSGLDLGGGQTRVTETPTGFEFSQNKWWDVKTTRQPGGQNEGFEYVTTTRTTAKREPISDSTGLRRITETIFPGGRTQKLTEDSFPASGTTVTTVDDSATTIDPDSESVTAFGLPISRKLFGAGETAPASTTAYDASDRVILTTDARGGATRHLYNAAGQLEQVIDPLGRATVYQYHPHGVPGAGRVSRVTNPAGELTDYDYDLHGLLTLTSGSGTYKTLRDYTDFDELKTLTTWRDTSGNGDTTTWHPDPASGVLLSKTYADGTATTFTYHDNGLLETRIWQRGVTTTYSYTNAGDLSGITYSDGMTPAVAITEHDRLGRPKEITDAGGTCTLTYHSTIPALVSEAYDSSHAALPGVTVASTFDSAAGRRTVLTATGHSVGFTYDDQGRLDTVTNTTGSFSHTYAYHPGTALVGSVTHKQSGNAFANQTTYTDLAAQVTGVETKSSGGTTLVRHGYQYNAAGRRTRATRQDGTYWQYGYNDRGEVSSGKKHITDQLYLAGQQFEYDYDDIGNRTTARSGGDGTGASLRTITYGTANAVNQYGTITHPGSYDILGRAPAAATVSVEADSVPVTPITRQGTPAERFHAAPTATNTSGPVWQEIEVSDGATTKAGHHFAPAASVTLAHDPDGNLAFDGRWDYVWDAENRLVKMTTAQVAQNVGVPYRELRFTYDWRGRRIRKQVLGPNESPISDHRFAYDGWNLIAEYTLVESSLTLLRRYVWGLDLSGSEQGAGGVGGLLSVKHSGTEYTPCYDGNGNVIAWLACVNGSANVVRRQEFDPFGNRIIHEGSLDLPIGFSTKYRDEETGLLYYGHRYLHTLLGRWPSPDPIGEEGGINLYAFVKNDGLNCWDVLGRNISTILYSVWTIRASNVALSLTPLYLKLDDSWGELREGTRDELGTFLNNLLLREFRSRSTGMYYLEDLGMLHGSDYPPVHWQSNMSAVGGTAPGNVTFHLKGDVCVYLKRGQRWAKATNVDFRGGGIWRDVMDGRKDKSAFESLVSFIGDDLVDADFPFEIRFGYGGPAGTDVPLL